MLTDFHFTRLPTNLAYGAVSVAAFATDVVTNGAGHEYRNGLWSLPRRNYRLAGGPRPFDELLTLQAFFEARRGRLHGFMWRDWADASTAQQDAELSNSDTALVALDKTNKRFAFSKLYGDGNTQYRRKILLADADSILLARDGVALTRNQDFTFAQQSGEIILTNPIENANSLTGGCRFYIPVRFDIDALHIERLGEKLGRTDDIPLIELRFSGDRI